MLLQLARIGNEQVNYRPVGRYVLAINTSINKDCIANFLCFRSMFLLLAASIRREIYLSSGYWACSSAASSNRGGGDRVIPSWLPGRTKKLFFGWAGTFFTRWNPRTGGDAHGPPVNVGSQILLPGKTTWCTRFQRSTPQRFDRGVN